MKKRLGWGCISLILALLSAGMSFYIQYRVLAIIGADSLMWFLFWANMPLYIIFTTIVNVVMKIYEEE